MYHEAIIKQSSYSICHIEAHYFKLVLHRHDNNDLNTIIKDIEEIRAETLSLFYITQ